MEELITAFFEAFAKGNIPMDVGLSIVIIGLMVFFYKKAFIKLDKRVNETPSIKEIEELIDGKVLDNKKLIEELNEKLDELSKKLDELDHIDDLSEGNYREIKELRRDVEHVKQILNQFQGHLLYGRGDFGNKGLK